VEAVYESVKGVEESISGYSGGHTENPTYRSSNTGKTGHAEAVEVIYDPEEVKFSHFSRSLLWLAGSHPGEWTRAGHWLPI
jgi:peptide methionine sulfoxide reductase MsrA